MELQRGRRGQRQRLRSAGRRPRLNLTSAKAEHHRIVTAGSARPVVAGAAKVSRSSSADVAAHPERREATRSGSTRGSASTPQPFRAKACFIAVGAVHLVVAGAANMSCSFAAAAADRRDGYALRQHSRRPGSPVARVCPGAERDSPHVPAHRRCRAPRGGSS